jgi:hypothetical protein
MTRRRLASPMRSFDMVPPHIVEAAKRLFGHWRRTAKTQVLLEDMGASGPASEHQSALT